MFHSVSFFFLCLFIFFEIESTSGGGAERGRQRIQGRLHVDSNEPDARLELTNREITTWAEAGCPSTLLLAGTLKASPLAAQQLCTEDSAEWYITEHDFFLYTWPSWSHAYGNMSKWCLYYRLRQYSLCKKHCKEMQSSWGWGRLEDVATWRWRAMWNGEPFTTS